MRSEAGDQTVDGVIVDAYAAVGPALGREVQAEAFRARRAVRRDRRAVGQARRLAREHAVPLTTMWAASPAWRSLRRAPSRVVRGRAVRTTARVDAELVGPAGHVSIGLDWGGWEIAGSVLHRAARIGDLWSVDRVACVGQVRHSDPIDRRVWRACEVTRTGEIRDLPDHGRDRGAAAVRRPRRWHPAGRGAVRRCEPSHPCAEFW